MGVGMGRKNTNRTQTAGADQAGILKKLQKNSGRAYFKSGHPSPFVSLFVFLAYTNRHIPHRNAEK
jgi:hypothetical protein